MGRRVAARAPTLHRAAEGGGILTNPFPGLRPFDADESHLFFGRERETDDLLRRLRTNRFVAVVGTSGSGKSSLVRSGLIPSLLGGDMVGAGSSWRIAVMRPSEDPIGHLARALDGPAVLAADPELADTNRVLIEVTLRRSHRGLIEAVRQARLGSDENLLVLVDQFEELFRFRESREHPQSRDEASAFVKLLLAATEQTERRIFVVLTMRSDFIGDCMNFPGLPEAVNQGLFLVGRMSRDGLRAAITGPVAVAGASIAPRLVTRAINDLGDDHDQLPRLQHALMRTWDHWGGRAADGPIDIEDYEAIGTFHNALSAHAEEAYAEAVDAGLGAVAERMFKALTDAVTDPRGVRRPTSVGTLAAITQASTADVIRVVDIFRAPGRSFLMPPVPTMLEDKSIVDLSHESLMRCWTRLIGWSEEERAAAAFYMRLSQAATWHRQGTAGLWRNPELELAQRWLTDTAPTEAWARRYDPGFHEAIAFLDESLDARARETAALEEERRRKLRRTQIAALVLAVLLLITAGLGLFAWRERQRAQANLDLARQAVDESLVAADRDPARSGADVPEVEEVRRELIAKAERFYLAFLDQDPRSPQMRRDLAFAHLRLGHINRMLERRPEAARSYREAITRLEALAEAGGRDDRIALAEAYNQLGETLRLQMAPAAEARYAYDRALTLHRALVEETPTDAQRRVGLARTLSNRGILRWTMLDEPDEAEADFREAIRLLEPVADASPDALQEIGRVANNLAGALDPQESDTLALFERAITGHERLVAEYPDRREYKLELATFADNLAVALHEQGQTDAAARRSDQALALIAALARPAPSVAIERADAHTLRGMILREQDRVAAQRSWQQALDLFAELGTSPAAVTMDKFHVRFGDLLIHLAAASRMPKADPSMRLMLSRGIDAYVDMASRAAEVATPDQRRQILATVQAVSQVVDATERARLAPLEVRLRDSAR